MSYMVNYTQYSLRTHNHCLLFRKYSPKHSSEQRLSSNILKLQSDILYKLLILQGNNHPCKEYMKRLFSNGHNPIRYKLSMNRHCFYNHMDTPNSHLYKLRLICRCELSNQSYIQPSRTHIYLSLQNRKLHMDSYMQQHIWRMSSTDIQFGIKCNLIQSMSYNYSSKPRKPNLNSSKSFSHNPGKLHWMRSNIDGN